MAERLMSLREVADFTRMSVSTVRRYIRQGRIPAYKIGQGITSPLRVREKDLLLLMEQNRIT
jgi:excisionase family DNA binding protein|tara:strand:+ start:104 stop:289 length:186 start_codon:yes stop_codon:yes gene_type:complete